MDPTEDIRRKMVGEINGEPLEYVELKKREGWVWDTRTLQEEFTVHGFLAPFVGVTRKKDGKRGLLTFQHLPRYYFNFQEE